MSSPSAKRRRYSNMKNLVVNDLNSINISSAELNEDIRIANEDFCLFFKSMEDRQTELFARTIGLEEKYMDLNKVLKGNPNAAVGESSMTNVQIDRDYAGSERRFLEDTSTSLNGHVKQCKDHLEEMLAGFKKFEAEWIKRISDWIIKAGEIEDQNSTMIARVDDLRRNI
ncbi:hypothetical protein POM88_011570 [Heracleum sosnowskyi]|uniref:Uncharacterized protein n=1 Tax=Heracleum sosnowskyi TaxID=360622 RepID=A0AAD8IUR5_9APIA|nr:hypothetical protein POM88_011570 [Heracleum sosnowskyi]